MPEKIKIVIADDHNLVRQSIAFALACDKSFSVIGQAENGKILLELIEKKSPDIIILDLEMPVMNGWEALDHLKVHHPECRVVVVSMHFDGLFIQDLAAKGARGFLPKNSDFETLINAIYDVHDIGYFFSRKISSAVVKELLLAKTIAPVFKESKLTELELKTLLLICNDKLTKEIAEELEVSHRTVERYKNNLFKKTKSKTIAGLVLFALKNNLITPAL